MLKKPIRILVLFGNIPLHGQERSNIQVMTCLQEAGADVLFLTNDEYGHESIQPMLDSLGLKWTEGRFPRLLGRSMSVKEWGDRISRVVRYNLAIRKAIRNFRPTHIHVANENHLLAAIPTLLGCRVPLVYRLGDEPRSHLPVFRFLWRRLYNTRISRLVCISQFIAESLLNVSGRHADRVIYNLPPDRSLDATRYAASEFDGFTVAYVGQLSREKGVDVLVESALHLCRERSDVRFVLAGDYSWENEFALGLISRSEGAGLSERIVFPGFVEDINGLLSSANVHVCPSVWEEPLGNVVVEAKRAGLPSVVFPSGGIPELIEDGSDGFICASKTQAELVKGLRFYLDSGRNLMMEHGRAARESLDRLGISREQFTKAWLEVYESCSP